jgi:putative restriction endonuclease
MNALIRSLIEKAGYANGWENVRESVAERVIVFSARHKDTAIISASSLGSGTWHVDFPNGPLAEELDRSFGAMRSEPSGYQVEGEAELGRLLRRAAELAMALPNQVEARYAQAIEEIERAGPSATEVIRLSKQRIGQNIFRQALMEYWGDSCALTGLTLPCLLKASHIKPWADCDSDCERLDVFNGFLLCSHYDSLFDAGYISFSDDGKMLLSPRLQAQELLWNLSSADGALQLRWISGHHAKYLLYHREKIFIRS